MKKKWVVITLASIVFLLALGLTLYPLLSDWYISHHESVLQTEYMERVQQTDDSALAEAWEAAVRYNEAIMPGAREEDAFSDAALSAAAEGYDDLLNILGNGVMGYVKIPKLDLKLPVYHGTASDTLNRGVGHLQGSSLPVGGEGTHAVLTAHSGMAGRKMFSDLDQLEVGDVFYLEVLGETLAYKIDQIRTVLPYETEELRIVAGKDLCTLSTCTPFSVNTHRLLVRGTRITYEEAVSIEAETVSGGKTVTSTWERQYRKGVMTGIAVAIFLVIAAVVLRRIRGIWRKKKCGEKG